MESIGLVHLLIISTCINAAIFLVLLLRKSENKNANRFLAALIFSMAFTLLTSLIVDFKWYDQWPELHWLPFSLTFAIGPAFYFYILFLNDPDKKFKRKIFWHFAPVILNYFHSIYHLIWGRNFPYLELHNFTEALELYALLPMLIYAWMSYKVLKKHQTEIRQQLSMTDNLSLRWIRQVKWVILFTLLPSLLFAIVDFEVLINFRKQFSEGILFQKDAFLHAGIAISIYWFSIGGFKQSQIQNNKLFLKSLEPKDSPKPEVDQLLLERLKAAMEDRQLYLDPTLSLKQLEEHLSIDARDISRALNHGLGQNFYAFVNGYRLEEVKKRILSKKYSHLSILGIALDSGFNSKATFNRIFKEQTGLSPKEFKLKKMPGVQPSPNQI